MTFPRLVRSQIRAPRLFSFAAEILFATQEMATSTLSAATGDSFKMKAVAYVVFALFGSFTPHMETCQELL